MSRLLLCAAVSGVLLGSFAPVRADDAEDKAAALVEKLGGKVTRDDTRPGKPVVGVRLSSPEVTGADLKKLAALKNLTTLDLYGTKVADPDLKELAPFQNLAVLHLSSGVTDAGLKHLAPLQNLTTLDLYLTLITDAGLKDVAALPKLTTLKLSFTKVPTPLHGASPPCSA